MLSLIYSRGEKMSSRMDKYEFDEKMPTASRTHKNAELYQKDDVEDFNKIDINSNVSVLKNDVTAIDVDKIREMLDKKYHSTTPQRKSIDIEMDEEPEAPVKETTKEYDINDIIAKAKKSQELDYHEERLRKLRDTNYTILDNLDLSREDSDEEPDDEDELTKEKELRELINTITELEDKSINKVEAPEDDVKDLLDLTDDTDPSILPPSIENSFYTGNLEVKEEDFDDFKEIQDDIKSNGIIIKILIFVFIIGAIIVGLILLNNFFEWGLF